MVWEADAELGGFPNVELWLPVSDVHKHLAVSQQSGVDDSSLEHYRQFLSFRRSCNPLIKGALDNVKVTGTVLSFTRTHGNETVYCTFTMGSEPMRCRIVNSD